MLTIRLLNTGKGTNENAAYKYSVHVNGEEIARGEYSGHNRDDGWAALLLDMSLRHLTPRALDGLYCPHCGELLSNHLITERGGYCQPARQ